MYDLGKDKCWQGERRANVDQRQGSELRACHLDIWKKDHDVSIHAILGLDVCANLLTYNASALKPVAASTVLPRKQKQKPR
jgi:hypothetical protein